MSLPDLRHQRSFFDADRGFARLVAAAPQGVQRYVWFSERIWPQLVALRPALETMYCADSRMSRLECVRETLRLTLSALEPIQSLARPECWALWWERYVESKLDYRAEAAQLRIKMEQAGEDARDVLGWVKTQQEKLVAAADAVALLARVYAENFEEKDQGTLERRAAPPPGAVQNPHDPQAQWSTKDTIKQKNWVGYKVQIAETVEEQPRSPKEPTCAVITAVVTQEAIASDKAALPVVEAVWEATGQAKPDELYLDAGYTSGAELDRARAEGRELKGPMAPAPTKEGRMSSEAFQVSVSRREAVCPAGCASTNCSRLEVQQTGAVSYRFEWNNSVCGACPLRSQCLGKGQKHRTLLVGEHHDLIQARRLEQKTASFQQDMRHRNAIEGTVSELTRGYRLSGGSEINRQESVELTRAFLAEVAAGKDWTSIFVSSVLSSVPFAADRQKIATICAALCRPFTKLYACASSATETGWRQVRGKAFMNESNAGNICFRLDYERARHDVLVRAGRDVSARQTRCQVGRYLPAATVLSETVGVALAGLRRGFRDRDRGFRL